MAITFVRSADENDDSVDIDCGSADTNRLLVLYAHVEGDMGWLSGVTADGKAMTLVDQVECSDAFGQIELYYIDENVLTTSNGTITISISGGSTAYILTAMLFTGVSQAGASDYGSFEDTSGVTDVTVPNITSADGSVVIMGSFEGTGGGATTSWTSPLTERDDQAGGSNTQVVASGIESTGQVNKTYTHVWDQSCNRIGGIVAVWSIASTEDFKDVSLTTSLESALTYKDVNFITSLESNFIYKDIALKMSISGGYDLTGVTYDKDGIVLVSCECFLLKDNQDDTLSFVAHTISHGTTGVYLFEGIGDDDAQYLVYAFKDDSPHRFDVTDHVLEPTE